MNASQIISLRNRLIHSYDNVDDSIIWYTTFETSKRGSQEK